MIGISKHCLHTWADDFQDSQNTIPRHHKTQPATIRRKKNSNNAAATKLKPTMVAKFAVTIKPPSKINSGDWCTVRTHPRYRLKLMDCVASNSMHTMSSFEKKKGLYFLECDTYLPPYYNVITFFRFELFQNKDALSLGVSLQNTNRIFSASKIFFQFCWSLFYRHFHWPLIVFTAICNKKKTQLKGAFFITLEMFKHRFKSLSFIIIITPI